MKRIKSRIPVILLLVISFVSNIYGQEVNTMYFMDEVPQANYLNPARQHRCDVYIGCPVAGPLKYSYNTNGLTYNSFVSQSTTLNDSVITFLHPEEGDKEAFFKTLQPINHLHNDLSFNLASIGIRFSDQYYVTFDIKEKFNTYIGYPEDLFMLLGDDGNAKGQMNMEGLAFNFTHYREYALGISQIINDEWTFGFRGKILFGKANVSSFNNFKITSDMDEWSIPRSSININATLPSFMDVKYDEDGYFEDITTSDSISTPEIKDYMFNTSNWGGAFDFGLIFTPSEKLEFDLSLVDLGAISWRKNVLNLEQTEEFSFRGADLNHMIDSTKPDETIDTMNLLGSSFNYTTPLPTKLFFGGRYILSETVSLGIISRTQLYNSKLTSQLTMSANFRSNFFSCAVSYSFMNNRYKNIGIGVNFKVGPFNLYVICDNVPVDFNEVDFSGSSEEDDLLNSASNNTSDASITAKSQDAVLVPYDFHGFNLNFGLNLEFGCKHEITDRPLIE